MISFNSYCPVALRRVLGFLFDQSKGQGLFWTIFFVYPILWGIDTVLSPFLLREIVNGVVKSGFENISIILPKVAAYFIWLAGFFAVSCAESYVTFICAIPEIRKSVSMAFFQKIIGFDAAFFNSNASGSVASKLSDAADQVFLIYRAISWGVIKTLVIVGFSFALFYSVDLYISVAFGLWSVFFIFISIFSTAKINNLLNALSRARFENNAKIVDLISNIGSVRLFQTSTHELSLADGFYSKEVAFEWMVEKNLSILWGFYNFTYYFFSGFCFLRVLLLINAGHCSIGDFLFVFQACDTLLCSFWLIATEVGQLVRSCSKVFVAMETILDYKPIVEQKPFAKPLGVVVGKIEFKSVRFNYPGCSEPIFSDKTITINPGQRVAIVGFSGGGKTTFINLILRNYDPSSGVVAIDGQDVKGVTLQSLRDSISVVTQDSGLLNRTIYQNIAYGSPFATMDSVIEAAKLAQAHDFIVALPRGYDAIVGDVGVGLSGGQKQRIAIARAMLKNAPILIFDEATSALDSVVEKKVQCAMESLMSNKTVIIIAHRLSTIQKMDRVLVFANGKIVQDGAPGALIKEDGIFRKFVENQCGLVN